MVVVVIIGILAAIAIPGYNGFQKKAKGSEAKVQLSAIYTGEAAYFAENQNYNSDLDKIGISTTLSTKYYNKIGFATGNGKFYIGHGNTSGSCTLTTHATSSDCTNAGGTWIPAAAAPAAAAGIACAVVAGGASGSFEACAQGTGVDSWYINNTKTLDTY